MTGRPLVIAVVREILVSARSQAVSSVATAVVVAGLCALVLLTAGRTAGSTAAVVGALDADGTRSIVVRADPDSGLTTAVFDRLARVDGVSWVGAFDAADDLSNSRVPGSAPIPVRHAYTSDPGRIGLPSSDPAVAGSAFASTEAARELGFVDGLGSLRDDDGRDVPVVGRFDPPAYLEFLEPAVLVPAPIDPDDAQPVGLLVVIAERPALVAPVAAATAGLLGVDDASSVDIETSARLAEIRASVEHQLDGSGRELVLSLFTLTIVIVTALQVTLVLLRRRDFGRRRALGATRSLIVAIVLGQAAVQGVIGAAVGTAVAIIATVAGDDPLPPLAFTVSVAVLAVAAGVVGSVIPAAVAARRDPWRELRVP